MAKVFDREDLIKDPFRLVFIGQSGCGKTTYLFNLLSDKMVYKNFKKVYCFSNLVNYHTQYKNFIWPDKYCDIITPKDGSKILEGLLRDVVFWKNSIIQEASEKHQRDPEPVLMIFDDCQNVIKSSSYLVNFITYCRHAGISIVILCQTAIQVPPTWRQNASHIVLFGIPKKKLILTIADEMLTEKACQFLLDEISRSYNRKTERRIYICKSADNTIYVDDTTVSHNKKLLWHTDSVYKDQIIEKIKLLKKEKKRDIDIVESCKKFLSNN